MATNFARPSARKSIPITEAKAKVLQYIQDGFSVKDACALVERSDETYFAWTKNDPEFKAAVAAIRSAKSYAKQTGKTEVPDFDIFCRDWLKQPLSIHQLRMWDVIEGRPPRDMHESMTYEAGYVNRVLICVPPEHAKSTTFTVNYSVWLIHKNPDVRIIIMSQGKRLAEKFLYEIKLKLTSPLYREMHIRFAPEGGWKDPNYGWTNSLIYVRGRNQNTDTVHKDATVEALGLGGQIYGTRADVIFLDDTITLKNAREIDRQETLLDREIESRLPSEQEGGGLLAILGTRVAPHDLYRHLREVEDGDERRIWTYLRQPAVLDYGDGNSETWTTLWPQKWNGPSLSKKRRNASWNLIYQQLDIDDEMTFKADAVNASVNGARFPGPMTETGHLHRQGGMEGLYRVAGMDPATVGKTAIIVAGLDAASGKRWILDGWNKGNANAQQVITKFKEVTETYRLHEWVIERNAFQRFITELPELVEFCRQRGCKITPHNSTANKFDEDWGIQTMAPLFDSCVVRDADRPTGSKPAPMRERLIELPSLRHNDWCNDLVQQLTIWQPEGMAQRAKTDLVMALWFTHIAFTKVLNRKRIRAFHSSTPFTTQGSRNRQGIIDLVALRRERQAQREGIA